ncbi:ATP-binding protein [Eggerthellaceae bacterium 24-137]
MSILADGRSPRAPLFSGRAPTADEAAAWEENRRRGEARRRLADAGIPPRYRDADLDGANPAIGEFVRRCAAGEALNLVIAGAAGEGKTHAACAALRAMVALRPCLAAFADEPAVFCEMRDTWGSREREDDVLCRYAAPRLLVLDDLGRAKHTDRTLEMLWRLVNRRYSAMRPTIYTCQYDRNALAARFQAGGGDPETAQAIVRRVMDDGNATVAEVRRG